MPQWTLEIDFDIFKDVAAEMAAIVTAAGPEMFPNYSQEAETISENAEILYKGYLLGKSLPNGKMLRKPAKDAAEGVIRKAAGMLQWDMMNTTDEAKRIEEGTPPFDMKTVLPKSKKARMSKNGDLYLIIPFRHGTPTAKYLNAMPKSIHKVAKQLAYSYHLGTVGTRISATGHEVPVFGYQWGDKLTKQQIASLGMDEKAQKRYQGMYRFGPAKHSNFITFRTMSQRSAGWIKPAVPGFFPMQQAIEVSMVDGMPKLAAAVQADFMAMIAPK